MFSDHMLHDIIITAKGTVIIIDIADTPDAGIEGAYAVITEEELQHAREEWYEEGDGEDSEYTPTVRELAEMCEETAYWEVVSNHHRTAAAAEKKLRRAIANL